MGQRKQEADHADGDRSRFDKICHSGGDTVLLAVEADDETGMHVDPSTIDLAHAVVQHAARILFFLRRYQRLRIGAFDADENV